MSAHKDAIFGKISGLTATPASVMSYAAMHKNASPSSVAALAAVLLLSACSGSEQAAAPPPTADAAMAEKAPVTDAAVVLPPAIKASRNYRCKDNSVVYITFMDDNVTAMVRDKQENPPIATLKASGDGQPYTGEGFSVSGSGETVTYTSPKTPAQSCKA